MAREQGAGVSIRSHSQQQHIKDRNILIWEDLLKEQDNKAYQLNKYTFKYTSTSQVHQYKLKQ